MSTPYDLHRARVRQILESIAYKTGLKETDVTRIIIEEVNRRKRAGQ